MVLIATAAITARNNIPQSTASICCRQFIDTECQLAKMKILLLTRLEVRIAGPPTDAEQRRCPLMALSRHPTCTDESPLSGVKADVTRSRRYVSF